MLSIEMDAAAALVLEIVKPESAPPVSVTGPAETLFASRQLVHVPLVGNWVAPVPEVRRTMYPVAPGTFCQLTVTVPPPCKLAFEVQPEVAGNICPIG
jgi:hypothetical protein